MHTFRTLRSTLLLAASLIAGTLLAQDATPLTVTMDYETHRKGKRVDKRSGTLTVTFGPDDRYAMTTRETAASPPVTVIFDGAKRTMTTVAEGDDGLVATVMPMLAVGDRALQAFGDDYEKTGKTREILGRTTHEYRITDDGDVHRAWIASIPELRWGDLAATLTGASAAQARAMLPNIPDVPDAFPLANTTVKRGGKVTTTSTVTALALGADADLSALEIPAGAVVNDLSAMMRF